MTTPGGMNSGFDHGDDFVAARVTIDVPTEGIAGLREITQEMDRFRTGVEAANRSSETFTGYLQRIAEAANQAATATENMVSMLERTTSYQNGAATGGGMPQLNASPQYSDPFAGAALGMGGGGGAGGGDVRSQLDSLREQNPRAYVNKMAASGQYRMGDIPATSPSGQDITTAADRINQRTQMQQEGQVDASGNSNIGSRSGRNGQIDNEMPGGGVSGGLRALGGLGRLLPEGALGTGLGRVAAVAGPLGAAIGGGLLANEAVQRVGGVYQDYKNMGSVRGGGAVEGMGYEIGIRALAMNPFISGDQSRQIIQQGLREGYTGKEFDTVTSMVANNLKEMNMDISQSFDLLRKNVKEGGMSEVGLGAALGNIKDMSQAGYRSLPELTAGYQQTSGALIGMGVGGPAASQAALISGAAGASSMTGKSADEQLVQAMIGSPQNLAIIKAQGGLNLPVGTMPQAIPFLAEGGPEGAALAQASEKVIKDMAVKYWKDLNSPKSGSEPWSRAIVKWQMYLRQLNIPWANDGQVVMQKFNQYTLEGRSPMAEGQAKNEQAQKNQDEVKGRNYLSRFGGKALSSVSATANDIGGFFGNIGGTIKDVFTDNTENIDDRWRNYNEKGEDRFAAANAAGKGYNIATLNEIQKKYGARGYEIVKDGKAVEFDQGNQDQMNQLSSGQLRVRQKGDTGAGYTLSETKSIAGPDLKGGMGGTTQVNGSVEIGLTDEARRLLKPVQDRIKLTPNEEKANAGYQDFSKNNRPPGDR
jgi:hypothetical protein